MNKFERADELSNSLMKKIKDDDVAEISIPFGFFMQPILIKSVCESSGYVPNKYIALINSCRTDVDFEQQMIQIYTKAGISKKQSLEEVKKLKDLGRSQFKRLFENDYRKRLKANPSYTKREHCKLFDDYAEEIVSTKIEEIKEFAPNTYKKYFAK